MIRTYNSEANAVRMRRLSISFLLSATTGLMAILLIASFSVPVRYSFDHWRRDSQAEARVRASARLFAASEALLAERSAVAPYSVRPTTQVPAATEPLTARTDRALAQALSAYAAARAAGAQLAVEPLRDAVRARTVALRRVKRALSQPETERALAVQAWRGAEARLSQILEHDAMAVRQKALADPFVQEMTKVRQMAWASLLDAREDQSRFEALLRSRARPTAQDLDHLAASLSEVRTRWALVDDEARLATTPPELKAAIDTANRTYFGEFLSHRAAAIDTLAHAALTVPPSTTDLADAGVAVATLGNVADVADRLAEAHAVRQTGQAAGDMVGPVLLLVLALVLGGSGFLIIFTRLVQPIAILTATMRRVAEGDLERPIPYGRHPDEIGELA